MIKECFHPTCGNKCRRIKIKKIRKPIHRISKKKQKTLPELKKISEKDKLFYQEIWEERPHVCFETGEYLGEEPFTLFFHHVLAKGARAYKQFRHYKWNIVLVNRQTHSQVELNIDKCPKIKQYREQIIKQHL